MASSQSIETVQFPVHCKLCNIQTEISSKCLECELLMCKKCEKNIHPNIKNAKNHRIVNIKDFGHLMDRQEMDFTNIKCQEHSGQTFCMFCKSCDQLVCPLCISKVHNGHGLVEIKEGYKIQMEKLETTEKKLSRELGDLNDKEQKIVEMKKTENLKYLDVKNRIKEQNTILKKAIDQYTADVLEKLNNHWEDIERSITKQQQKTTELQKVLEENKSLVKNLMESQDAGEMFSDVTGLLKSIDKIPDMTEFKCDTMPVFCPGKISQYNFGQLNQSPSKALLYVAKSFTTDLEIVSRILVHPTNSVWMSCKKEEILQKVQLEDDNLKMISIKKVTVYDMAISPSNDILLVTGKSTLEMINKDSGECHDTNYRISPLLPVSVHVSTDNKIIVGGITEEKGAVIVMDIEGNHEVKYENDKNNEPLFRYPLVINSTRNSNIFVIDEPYGIDGTGKIIILEPTGDVVNVYRGHPETNGNDDSFEPIHMASTPSDNIIVTSTNTGIINILNNTGYLIKYCNMNNLGIKRPYSLAINRSGKLYIGCTRKEGSTEKNAKLYEVNISGF